MTTFDFLHIDAGIVNGKIVGKAGSALGEMMLPVPIKMYDKIPEDASLTVC